jgi:hypothetical protein
MTKPKRHDELAHERQQRLARLLVLANGLIGAISVAIIYATTWSLGLNRTEWVVIGGLILVSWLNLLIAAGSIGGAVNSVMSMMAEGSDASEKPVDARLLERWRMGFYYVGVWANLLALATIIEVTGGLVGSPFVALLIAFVLTGQQLSRFRMQSGLLYVSGLVVLLSMILLEPVFTKPSGPAPDELTLSVVAMALVASGWLNYVEKPHNYLVENRIRQPTRARIYRDGAGVWRVVLLERIHRLDPVLYFSAESADVTDGEFPAGLQDKFRNFLDSMSQDAGWAPLEPKWPERCGSNFTVNLRPGPSAPGDASLS